MGDGDTAGQVIRRLSGEYVVELHVASSVVPQQWLWMVRSPEGLTVVRPRQPGLDEEPGWSALYTGDQPHGLDVPGMLSAIIRPLAEAKVPVFVASTYNADLVLVPRDLLREAESALGRAGHQVTGDPMTPEISTSTSDCGASMNV